MACHGLARARGPQQGDHFAGFHLEVDGKQCVDPGVALAIVLGDTGHILRSCWRILSGRNESGKAQKPRQPIIFSSNMRQRCGIGQGARVGTRT